MSQEDENKKWDLKQLGVGGGSVLAALFLFQSQGIDLMNRQQDTQAQLVLERTQNNSQRISKMELQIKELDAKIERGFGDLRSQIRLENAKLSDLIRLATADRWTRADHNAFNESLERRFYRNEADIKSLQKQIQKNE